MGGPDLTGVSRVVIWLDGAGMRRLPGDAPDGALAADRDCAIWSGCDMTINVGIAATDRVCDGVVGSDIAITPAAGDIVFAVIAVFPIAGIETVDHETVA